VFGTGFSNKGVGARRDLLFLSRGLTDFKQVLKAKPQVGRELTSAVRQEFTLAEAGGTAWATEQKKKII
jgi:hypothetical protein